MDQPSNPEKKEDKATQTPPNQPYVCYLCIIICAISPFSSPTIGAMCFHIMVLGWTEFLWFTRMMMPRLANTNENDLEPDSDD